MLFNRGRFLKVSVSVLIFAEFLPSYGAVRVVHRVSRVQLYRPIEAFQRDLRRFDF